MAHQLRSMLLIAAVVLSLALTPTLRAAAQQSCTLDVDPSTVAITLDDFGRSDEVYGGISQATWVDRGAFFLYGRDRGDEMASNPQGAYLWGEVDISTPDQIGNDFRRLISSQLKDWRDYREVPHPMVGDYSVIYQRDTSWEMMPESPAVETLVAFYRCNVTGYAVFATMPEYDPGAQALRYLRLMAERLPG